MRKKALASLGLIALLAAGLAVAGVISGVAGTIGTTTQSSSDLTIGGSLADFTYDGQTISQTAYGQPWTAAHTSQSGWVQTPLQFTCEGGTLALAGKVSGNDIATTGNTATFTPPSGTVIVGVLWKSGQNATATGATWAADGSSATVTLSKRWADSRVFYCTPTPTTSYPGSSVPPGSGTFPGTT